jgi:hypothetical protein
VIGACVAVSMATGDVGDLSAQPVSAATARVAYAVQQAATAKGMKFDYTARVGSSARTTRVVGTGTVNGEQSGRMSMKVTDVDRSAATTTITRATILSRTEGSNYALYTKTQPTTAGTPVGKQWAKMTIFKGAKQASFKLVGGTGLPTTVLGVLRSATRNLRVVGHERVRGARTSRYRATLDLAKMAARRPAVRASLRMLADELGTKRLVADVWIDKSGRVRRERLRYTTPGAFPRPAAAHDIKVTFYGFGAKVDVRKPAAGLVFDGGSVTP